MRGLTITGFDEQHVLKVGLADVLAALGPDAENSTWALSDVEALGGAPANELNRISDEQQAICGKDLARLARAVDQVIDGEFRAYRKSADSPWLVIYAVDSSAYDVSTDDDDALNRLRSRFDDVSEMPTS